MASDDALTLSKYERSRLISHRVSQLERNAKSDVSFPKGTTATLFDIAAAEVDSRAVDLTVQRLFPDGRVLNISLSKFPRRRAV